MSPAELAEWAKIVGIVIGVLTLLFGVGKVVFLAGGMATDVHRLAEEIPGLKQATADNREALTEVRVNVGHIMGRLGINQRAEDGVT